MRKTNSKGIWYKPTSITNYDAEQIRKTVLVMQKARKRFKSIKVGDMIDIFYDSVFYKVVQKTGSMIVVREKELSMPLDKQFESISVGDKIELDSSFWEVVQKTESMIVIKIENYRECFTIFDLIEIEGKVMSNG